MPHDRRMWVRVTGRVQAVGFRFATVARAEQLGLRGWVRNTDDRAVEAVFQGPEQAVERAVAFCHEGPPSAHVDGVETRDEPPVDGEPEFRAR